MYFRNAARSCAEKELVNGPPFGKIPSNSDVLVVPRHDNQRGIEDTRIGQSKRTACILHISAEVSIFIEPLREAGDGGWILPTNRRGSA